MKAKVKVGPEITKACADYITARFSSLNAGARKCLSSMIFLMGKYDDNENGFDIINDMIYQADATKVLNRKSLLSMKGVFTFNEIMCMLDITNSLGYTAHMAGDNIIPSLVDGIELDQIDKKWSIDGDNLRRKLYGLHHFDSHCLETWLKKIHSMNGKGIREEIEKIAIE